MRLDSRDILDEEAAKSIRRAENFRVQQYQAFAEMRLVNSSKPLDDPARQPQARDKSKSKLHSLKIDCSLFFRLYIGCQSRDGDFDEFFRHKNQRCPPSPSRDGKLCQCKKSDLLDCLSSSTECHTDAPDSDVIILDGAGLIMLKPVACKTFDDYAAKVSLPYNEKKLKQTDRLYTVWRCYLET